MSAVTLKAKPAAKAATRATPPASHRPSLMCGWAVNCYGAQFNKNPLGLAPLWVDDAHLHIHNNVDQVFTSESGATSVHPLVDPMIDALWLWKPFGMDRTPHPSGRPRRYFATPQNGTQEVGARYFTALCKRHGKRAVLYTGPTVDGVDESQRVIEDSEAMSLLDSLGFDEIYFDDAMSQTAAIHNRCLATGRIYGVEPVVTLPTYSQVVFQCALERYRGGPWKSPGLTGYMRKVSMIIDGSRIDGDGEKIIGALTDAELDDYAERRWYMVGLAHDYRVRVVDAVRRANARAEVRR